MKMILLGYVANIIVFVVFVKRTLSSSKIEILINMIESS